MLWIIVSDKITSSFITNGFVIGFVTIGSFSILISLTGSCSTFFLLSATSLSARIDSFDKIESGFLIVGGGWVASVADGISTCLPGWVADGFSCLGWVAIVALCTGFCGWVANVALGTGCCGWVANVADGISTWLP